MSNNNPTTLAEIRFQISSCFREAERLIDILQQEVGILNKKLADKETLKEEEKHE